LIWQTRVLLVFPTIIAIILGSLGWKIFIVVAAARCANRTKNSKLSVPFPKFTYTVLIAVMVLAALLPSWNGIKERSGFAAFKVPSASMCPTICIGDYLVADTHAYRPQPPVRGDIIMMKHASSDALFLKRVIALPGDRVSPGPNGSVLVKRPALPPARALQRADLEKREPADYSSFRSTTVPEGTFFVVGDNLEDSYDSRLREFGAVTADMIRGRPLYFYWSPTFSRIGCQIH
jgi:signal peptidase I